MIIKIQGGLGNQMFQYAYGRCLELSGKKVIFDVSFYFGNKSSLDTVRNFKLNYFNIQTMADFSNKKRIFKDIILKIKRKIGFDVDVYFQNEKYFKKISTNIRKEFVLKFGFSENAENILKMIKDCNSTSIHIRRGDYVSNSITNSFHGVCGIDYYKKAIEIVKKRSKNSDCKFFIFSDDIDWSKNNLIGDEFFFASSNSLSDVEELLLMSNCNNNIIANSSFSWWGAWLNNNVNKIVISPIQWFKNKKANKKNNIILESWIKI